MGPSSAAVRDEDCDEAPYFEIQDGAWCGVYAINHYLGGPYATKGACRRAARSVVATLPQVGAGDVEDLAQHLDPLTGFLSIGVINVIGATTLGIDVEGGATLWPTLQAAQEGGALVNWGQPPLDVYAQGARRRHMGPHEQRPGERTASWPRAM